MRRRAWTAWACLAAGITLGLLGRLLPGEEAWNLLAGLGLLAAIVLGLSLLPVWGRLAPGLVPMRDLFDAPRPSERWCLACGHPTGRSGPCRHCGDTPASPADRKGRVSRLQTK